MESASACDMLLEYLETPSAVGIFVLTLMTGLCGAIFVNRFNFLYLLLHKVEEESHRHGGELVAEVLKCHGIKTVFTLVGGHISPILVALEKQGLRVVDTRHEVTAVFAADAAARMSGCVGVAAVTAGPGLTNTITAVKNAQMAESPVLLIGGAAASILKGRGSLQDIDQMSLFRPLCKYCATVTSVRDIVPTVKKALQAAQSGTPGPVFVEFPLDVLYPYHMVKREVGVKSGGKGLVSKIVNWYLNNYVQNIFAGAWEPVDATPLPVNIPLPSPGTVQKCAELVSKSKQPVIVVGSQATLPPTPVKEVRQSLECLGIPCFLGGMSRGLLGSKSPVQVRQRRRDALKEADVVLLLGSVCDFRLGYGKQLSSKSKIIAVNRNHAQLYKNSDMFWKPAIAVQSDVGTFLKELSVALKGYSCEKEWLETLQQRDADKEKQTEKMAEDPTDIHLNPLKVLHELEAVLPDDAVIVADGGDFVATASYILRPRSPLSWLDPGAFGTLGVGGGFALGAKVTRPESEVWIVYGDGSCGYSIAEFDTYTRHKLPVLAIVGNDAGWTQITREQVPMFGSSVACDLDYTDYHTVAAGFGGKGFLLNREHNDKISEVLQVARKEYAAGHSVLVNGLIGKTKFREGSVSV